MARTPEQLQELSKVAAYRIKAALDLFKDEDQHTQQVANNVIMERVQRFMNGEKLNIEGEGLVTEIPEPGQADQINTPKQEGEPPEAV